MRTFLVVSVLFWFIGGLTACSIISDLPVDDYDYTEAEEPAITEVGGRKGVKVLGQREIAESVSTPVGSLTTTGSKVSTIFARNAINDPSSTLSQKTVYFEYDKSGISPKYNDVISDHAKYLAAYPNASVRLEGHTDERASREYNIALGERRAASVKRQLLWQGVGTNQVSIISYGEEKPMSRAHNEESWALNRRVEFVYEAP